MSARDGDGLVMAFELVLTTVIFGAIGFALDHWLGTFPAVTVALAAATCGCMVWKIVTGYDAQMADHLSRRQPLRRGPADG
jgi:Putative F0F1-ATPase subunit Ca2+/Mg2+ transporter